MKIAITGHTQGIGQYIYENTKGCEVIGFSKSTGYDITKRDDIFRILSESDDCDVFINNADDGFGQALLLIEAYNRWKDTNKLILNIGSRIVNDDFELPSSHAHLLEYRLHKLALKDACENLQRFSENLDIRYITFAYVGTKKILEKYPHFKHPDDYITLGEVYDLIMADVFYIA